MKILRLLKHFLKLYREENRNFLFRIRFQIQNVRRIVLPSKNNPDYKREVLRYKKIEFLAFLNILKATWYFTNKHEYKKSHCSG